MHSSRMRTGRSLTVCCSLLPGGRCLLRGGVSALGGSAPWVGVCSGGVPPCPGGSLYPKTPPVNRITHTCKNITLATTSLRPVKTGVLCICLWCHCILESARSISFMFNTSLVLISIVRGRHFFPRRKVKFYKKFDSSAIEPEKVSSKLGQQCRLTIRCELCSTS